VWHGSRQRALWPVFVLRKQALAQDEARQASVIVTKTCRATSAYVYNKTCRSCPKSPKSREQSKLSHFALMKYFLVANM
jgi:hypothetical protein